jgi:hypothetical protein
MAWYFHTDLLHLVRDPDSRIGEPWKHLLRERRRDFQAVQLLVPSCWASSTSSHDFSKFPSLLFPIDDRHWLAMR